MLQKIINLLRKKMKTQFLKPKPHHCLLLKLLMEHHQQVNTKFEFFFGILFLVITIIVL